MDNALQAGNQWTGHHLTNSTQSEKDMVPPPISDDPAYRGTGKLQDKIVLITGGESGIGKAISTLFVKEGAKMSIGYFSEDEQDDVATTKQILQSYGGQVIFIQGDLADPQFCKEIVEQTVSEYGRIDILINNAATQFEEADLANITYDHLCTTFKVNIISMYLVTQAALPFMKTGSVIINTSSVTAYEGNPILLDYSATKGAIISFTRSLSRNLVNKGIRVNGVAPGPIWTPLIHDKQNGNQSVEHGRQTPMQRAGQPVEIAPSYLFLATDSSSYMTGQILHPNGGSIVNG